MAIIYAKETAHTKVRVNLIDPGSVNTKMFATAFPGADLKTMTQPDQVTDIFVTAARADFDQTGQILSAQKA